jgi:hypothetical protein
MYKLRDWIDETELTNHLSYNERAVEYLENHTDLILDEYFFGNENALHVIKDIIREYNDEDNCVLNYNKNAVNFLRNNHQYINYRILCGEAHGIEFVDELIKNNQLDKIDWAWLSRNPAAMHILNDPKYYQYIDWHNIIHNENAVELVKNNLHMLGKYWYYICQQPYLIDIIEQNMDNINWNGLSYNYNAIHLLEKNLEKINETSLCMNKNGFELLLRLGHNFDDCDDLKIYDEHIVLDYFDYCEKNNIFFDFLYSLSRYGYTDKHFEYLKKHEHLICYISLSQNPNIFEYDYTRMRKTRQSLPWYNNIKN